MVNATQSQLQGRARRSIAAYYYTKGYRDARECLRPKCVDGDWKRCPSVWKSLREIFIALHAIDQTQQGQCRVDGVGCPKLIPHRCTCPWHNTLWKDPPCLACTHHLMQKKFGNGACGVRMKGGGGGGKLMLRAKRRRKSLGHPSHQGPMAAPMHHALARFHSEHVGN